MEKEKKTDLRVIKTYSSLTKAFYQLLSEKKFESITINELCNRAGIRRATFYKHFSDKNEFLAFVTHNLLEQYSRIPNNQKGHSDPAQYYIQITRSILHFLSEREKMVYLLSESGMYSTLMTIFTDEITKELVDLLYVDIEHGAVFPASAEITAQFFTGAIINCIKYWFAAKERITEDQLLEELTALLQSFTSTVHYSYAV
jgi:AcrR family transcriptional regulator